MESPPARRLLLSVRRDVAAIVCSCSCRDLKTQLNASQVTTRRHSFDGRTLADARALCRRPRSSGRRDSDASFLMIVIRRCCCGRREWMSMPTRPSLHIIARPPTPRNFASMVMAAITRPAHRLPHRRDSSLVLTAASRPAPPPHRRSAVIGECRRRPQATTRHRMLALDPSRVPRPSV